MEPLSTGLIEMRQRRLVEAIDRLRPKSFNQRIVLIGLVDIGLTISGLFIAFLLRLDFTLDGRLAPQLFIELTLWLILARGMSYAYFGVERRAWSHVSVPDLYCLVCAHLTTSLIFGTSLLLTSPEFFPRSILAIELLVSLFLAITARIGMRVLDEKSRALKDSRGQRVGATGVVVLGAGTSGHLVVKTLVGHQKHKFSVRAVFDDNNYLCGSFVHGIPVVGQLNSLDSFLAERTDIGAIILAIPTLNMARVEELKTIADQHFIPLKTIQAFEEIAFHEIVEPKPRRTIEEILERENVVEHEEEIRDALRGKRIVITGAGGSIGSEIVRQVLGFAPGSIVLVDQSEYQLFAIQQEIDPHSGKKDTSVDKHFVIADITNRTRMERVFDRFRPQIVLHAAAYKHVPLMEANCYEAFNTNIIGTRNILELATRYGAERFVLISTDKAVDPSSVMGSTKRVAEMMVEAHANYNQREVIRRTHEGNLIDISNNRGIATAAVRFGNVINSSGSVIPTFKKQILEGRALTVTHPDITRYFMSIKQAVRLVLTAGTLGNRGDIYLLDMGSPIKIVDVAKKLRALYGRRDLPIKFTGLRQGEKLYESLVSQVENVQPSPFRKVNIVRASVKPKVDVFEWVDQLREKLDTMDDETIGQTVRSFVLEWQKPLNDTDGEVATKVAG
jgi:FlaA1/EpsC-like NDP-sugar epimerase